MTNKFETKPFWKSKAVWGSLLVTGAGVLQSIGLFLQGELNMSTMINQVIPLVGTGLALMGIRLGDKKLSL